MAMGEKASKEVLDEFRKTGKVPSGYTFNGRTLARTIADKQEAAATQSDDEAGNESPGSNKTKKSGK